MATLTKRPPNHFIATNVLPRLLRRVRRAIPRRDHVWYRGCVLPAADLRRNMCGSEYTSDEHFLRSADAEASRLMRKLAYEKTSTVVDIGCGLGRLACGLLRQVGQVQYWGFDAVAPWVKWCKKHIERDHPSFRFSHVNVRNEHYNPAGSPLTDNFRFDLPDGHADIVYMWGVMTNMRLHDARIYISEIGRLTRPGGRAFVTAFVEESVPAESINPPDYVDYKCEGPLAVTRYEKTTLLSTFAEHGFSVEDFGYHTGAHCNQSEIYLVKGAACATHQ